MFEKSWTRRDFMVVSTFAVIGSLTHPASSQAVDLQTCGTIPSFTGKDSIDLTLGITPQLKVVFFEMNGKSVAISQDGFRRIYLIWLDTKETLTEMKLNEGQTRYLGSEKTPLRYRTEQVSIGVRLMDFGDGAPKPGIFFSCTTPTMTGICSVSQRDFPQIQHTFGRILGLLNGGPDVGPYKAKVEIKGTSSPIPGATPGR